MRNNLGNVLREMGQLEQALDTYKQAAVLAPKHADCHNNIGLIHKQRGELDAALEACRRACELAPARPDFRFNLGNMLYAREDYPAAVDAYREALRGDPQRVEWLNQLGHALRHAGQHAEAAEAYRQTLALSEDQAETQLYLGHSLLRQELIDDAVDAYRKALALKPDLDKAYLSLGMLLNALGRRAEAEDVWRAWLQVTPDQPTARHMLAASGADGVAVPDRAQDDYVQELFDKFAPDFDRKLANLNYRAPQLLVAKLADFRRPQADLDVLDAGCGTGLCGPLLRDYAARLVGVDLSPGMLALAAERDCFDALIEAELTSYLGARQNAYDLILSADTLVYFGDLDAVLKAAAGALRAGGLLLFSLEVGSDDGGGGFQLNAHGRYSHGRGYLERALADAGLTLHDLSQDTLRREGQQPVRGWLVVAGV